MTSRSNPALLVLSFVGLLVAGCGSSTPTEAPKADAGAAQVQQGEGGRKAAAGGGVAPLGLEPAKPGEATGPLVGGRK